MLKGKERKPKKNKIRDNLVYGTVLSAAFLLFVVILVGEHEKALALEAQISSLAYESSEAAKRNQELREELNATDDDEQIEKIARERLKMVRPDEIIYIDKNK